MKTVDLTFNLKTYQGGITQDKASDWVRTILGSGASEKESDFLKIFSLVEKLNSNPGAVELDEGDEALVKKEIEAYKQIDNLGSPRVNSYMKAQLILAINNTKSK